MNIDRANERARYEMDEITLGSVYRTLYRVLRGVWGVWATTNFIPSASRTPRISFTIDVFFFFTL